MNDKEQTFAIIRIDLGSDIPSDIADRVTVTQVLPTQQQAENEVKRLNSLNANKGVFYFWQTTRGYTRRGPARPALVQDAGGDWQSLAGGLLVPPDFPTQPYKILGEDLRRELEGRPEPAAAAFWAGWSGLAYRFSACARHDEAFTESLVMSGVGPPFPARQLQDEELFEFFFTGWSALECLVAAIIWIITHSHEPRRGTDKFVESGPLLSQAAKRLRRWWPNESLGQKLMRLASDSSYLEFRHARNLLAHGAHPARSFSITAGDPGPGQAVWRGLNIAIDPNTTRFRRVWLAGAITDVVDGLRDFRNHHRLKIAP